MGYMRRYTVHCAGNLHKAVPRLRECCGQVEAEEVSNSTNKIHQTWERPYGDSLYPAPQEAILFCSICVAHCTAEGED